MARSQHLTYGADSMIRLDQNHDDFPVIKMVRPDDQGLRRQIQREHEIMLHLSKSPEACVRVHPQALVDEHGAFGLEMEELLPARNDDILSRFEQLEELVNNLHRQNIVHGDLSLSNVMLNPEHELRLIDCGHSGRCGQDVPLERQALTQCSVFEPHIDLRRLSQLRA